MALPIFVSHRSDCSHIILKPNIDLHSHEQIEDLKGRSHFVATFQESKIEEKEDLYDIYINLAAVEITISRNSREVFSMTKTHKEVAIAFVRVAENDSCTDEEVANEIAKKTLELINSIYQLIDGPQINSEVLGDSESCAVVPKSEKLNLTKSKLHQKLLSPNLESFYWNLAVAEGIADQDHCKFENII